MKKFKEWKTRKWLNPATDNNTGAIAANVYGDEYSAGGEVVIRDCSQQVRLDFYVVSNKQLEQRQKKLNIMIDILVDMSHKLEEAWKYHEVAKKEKGNGKENSILRALSQVD